MPLMTNNQRVEFLIHLYNQIFFVIRFPFKLECPKPQDLTQGLSEAQLLEVAKKLKKWEDTVALYQQHIARVTTGPEWSPFIVGGVAKAITFRCKERNGSKILMGFDIELDLGLANPYPIRVMEQNPFKLKNGVLTKPAQSAQRGQKIVWVIHNVKDGDFLGKVQDGVWMQSKPRAYTAKTMTPLRDVGAGIVKTEKVSDQYGVDHYNMDGDWIDDLDVIGGEDDVLGVC